MLPQDDNRPPVPPADLILVTRPFNEEDLEQVRRSFDIEGLNHRRVLERALNAALPWREGEARSTTRACSSRGRRLRSSARVRVRVWTFLPPPRPGGGSR